MKTSLIFATVTLLSAVSCWPVHNGMFMYRAAPAYMPAYHQAMLVQYSQPKYARSAAGTGAYAAGDSIAAGTYLRDCNDEQTESKVQLTGSASEPQSSYDNSEDAHALAEAYPEEVPAVINEAQRQDDQSVNEVAPTGGFAPVPDTPETPLAVTEAFPLPEDAPFAPGPVAPVPPPKTPKTNVHVEIDDDDDNSFSPFPPKGKNQGPVPSYSFFPLTFGRTNGGAIAIANAFSTGKGAARSHAIAYGSSAAKRSVGKHLDVA